MLSASQQGFHLVLKPKEADHQQASLLKKNKMPLDLNFCALGLPLEHLPLELDTQG